MNGWHFIASSSHNAWLHVSCILENKPASWVPKINSYVYGRLRKNYEGFIEWQCQCHIFLYIDFCVRRKVWLSVIVIVCVINHGLPPFLKLERFSSGRRGNIDDTCSMCDDDDGTGRKAWMTVIVIVYTCRQSV